MKKIGSMLLVSLIAGAITLGAYKLFFEQPNISVVGESSGLRTFNTSVTPTSAKGSGINEVDFTVAAENTVNAVVHVKNVTLNSGGGSIMDILLWIGRRSKGTGRYRVRSDNFPDGYI